MDHKQSSPLENISEMAAENSPRSLNALLVLGIKLESNEVNEEITTDHSSDMNKEYSQQKLSQEYQKVENGFINENSIKNETIKKEIRHCFTDILDVKSELLTARTDSDTSSRQTSTQIPSVEKSPKISSLMFRKPSFAPIASKPRKPTTASVTSLVRTLIPSRPTPPPPRTTPTASTIGKKNHYIFLTVDPSL